ncbi:MAG: hypothetical protein HY394_03580 [Candidatus Diapherotrites archaeon]|nr:hypothetical protein [Candidatus Diapherotrites archaeon]
MRQELKRLVVRLQDGNIPLDDPVLDWAVNEIFRTYCLERGLDEGLELDKISAETGFDFLFYLIEELDCLEKEQAAEKQKILA